MRTTVSPDHFVNVPLAVALVVWVLFHDGAVKGDDCFRERLFLGGVLDKEGVLVGGGEEEFGFAVAAEVPECED